MENLEINLAVTVADAQILLNALGKLPLETSVSVWMKIKNQAEVQIAAANQAITMAPAEEQSE
jgi:hypothetical protein